MLTMVESSTTMSCATPTSASTAQRLGSAARDAAADIVREYKAAAGCHGASSDVTRARGCGSPTAADGDEGDAPERRRRDHARERRVVGSDRLAGDSDSDHGDRHKGFSVGAGISTVRHCGSHATAQTWSGASGGLISRLRILPVGPLGSSSTSQTWRGYL